MDAEWSARSRPVFSITMTNTRGAGRGVGAGVGDGVGAIVAVTGAVGVGGAATLCDAVHATRHSATAASRILPFTPRAYARKTRAARLDSSQMPIDRQTVVHVADLARIALTDAEV